MSEKLIALNSIRKFTVNGFCKKCGVRHAPHVHTTDSRGVKMYKCPICKHKFSEFYGTIFYNTKIPLVKWRIAIIEWVMRDGEMTPAELRDRLGIKYDSAVKILQKMRKEFISVLT